MDENLQLDADFARVEAQAAGNADTLQANLPLPAAAFVASLNSKQGAVQLQGGSTGFSFSSGGASVIILTGASTSVKESGGATLSVGAIADGQFVKRSGATLIGFTFSAQATAKSNVAAVAPTVNDDSTQSYSRFSLWIDSALNDVYLCCDPAAGAAVWRKLN